MKIHQWTKYENVSLQISILTNNLFKWKFYNSKLQDKIPFNVKFILLHMHYNEYIMMIIYSNFNLLMSYKLPSRDEKSKIPFEQ